ncbi:MAG: hypothetical protein NT096_03950 [Proteobacteria bacterium]|nr:hypothetical protein [Pseudomonadota bacterium]
MIVETVSVRVIKNFIKKALTYKRWAAELSIGLCFVSLTNLAFDCVLYPFIIYKFGILIGGAVMTLLSFLICLLLLQFYDWAKRDWLGIEAIKNIKEYNGDKRIGQFTSWVMKKGDSIAFLFLSLRFDPFITTAYMRHGKYNGMSKRDWKIFTGSLVTGNAYWTLACYMGITLVEWIWKTVS